MTCPSSLPIEILQKIIKEMKKIRKQPFKTELLLINKTFCSLLMAEQVKNLTLSNNQINRWITLIINDDMEKACSVQRYCNLLDQIYEFDISSHEKHHLKAITRFIGRCINLRKLILKIPYTYVSLPDVNTFFNNLPFNITEIRLYSIPINNDEAIQSLVKYLRRSTKLKILHLFGNDVGDNGTCILAEYLKQNVTITQLHVQLNDIGSEGACTLAECLRQNSTLTHLRLGKNNIGDVGASALAKCLSQNTALTQLNIWENRISSEGACELAKHLERNSTLTELDLEVNKIGNQGAYALAKCLKQNSTLKRLEVGDNGIGDEGACALAEALKRNSTLIRFGIGRNDFSFEGANALTKSWEQNDVLIHMDLIGQMI